MSLSDVDRYEVTANPDSENNQETVTCPGCGIDYIPSRYVNVRGAKIPQCPECGTINVPTVLSDVEEEEREG